MIIIQFIPRCNTGLLQISSNEFWLEWFLATLYTCIYSYDFHMMVYLPSSHLEALWQCGLLVFRDCFNPAQFLSLCHGADSEHHSTPAITQRHILTNVYHLFSCWFVIFCVSQSKRNVYLKLLGRILFYSRTGP